MHSLTYRGEPATVDRARHVPAGQHQIHQHTGPRLHPHGQRGRRQEI